PIRPIEGDNKAIYRSFTFGNLVSLNMLETRLLARDKQLSYTDYYDENGKFDETRFTQDLTSESRKLIGDKQFKWLQNEFSNSSTIWQVIAQQVLMGRMWLPAEVLSPIAQLDNPEAFGTTKEELIAKINNLIEELVSIKMEILKGKTVKDEIKTRLNKTLPYNLDAWDGYPIERERLFALAKGYQKNLVVLSGDTHNSWGNNLKDINGEKIGVEFATTSVSSPGMEEYLGLNSTEDAKKLESALEVLLDDLKYTNLNNRGFLEVIFTQDEAKATWHHIDNVDSKEYEIIKSREKTLVCKFGKKELEDPS
ncbi:MAG TPA: alkaline phosphatase, partial [Candidatus Atribacteria bacterium]|nr:alkaline phosphatase [Candidatus Atribacteria bacterium]